MLILLPLKTTSISYFVLSRAFGFNSAPSGLRLQPKAITERRRSGITAWTVCFSYIIKVLDDNDTYCRRRTTVAVCCHSLDCKRPLHTIAHFHLFICCASAVEL